MKRETVKSFFGKTLIFQILFFVAALFLTIYFFPREENSVIISKKENPGNTVY